MIDITNSSNEKSVADVSSIQDVLRYYIKEEQYNISVFRTYQCNRACVESIGKRIDLLQQLLQEYPHEEIKMKGISVFRGRITHCQVGYCIDAPEKILSYIKQITIEISNTSDGFIRPVERIFEMDIMLSAKWFGNELCDRLIDDAGRHEVAVYVNTNNVIVKLEIFKPILILRSGKFY